MRRPPRRWRRRWPRCPTRVTGAGGAMSWPGAGDRRALCLTGARSYVAIGEWATAQGQAVLDCLDGGPSRVGVPCEATLRRCLQVTDPAALDAAVAGWAVGQLAVQQALAAGAHADLLPADSGRTDEPRPAHHP